MKVDGGIGLDLDKAATAAKEREDAGYSGIWTAETNHDPFLPLVAGGRAHPSGSSWAPASPWPSPATR